MKRMILVSIVSFISMSISVFADHSFEISNSDFQVGTLFIVLALLVYVVTNQTKSKNKFKVSI